LVQEAADRDEYFFPGQSAGKGESGKVLPLPLGKTSGITAEEIWFLNREIQNPFFLISRLLDSCYLKIPFNFAVFQIKMNLYKTESFNTGVEI